MAEEMRNTVPTAAESEPTVQRNDVGFYGWGKPTSKIASKWEVAEFDASLPQHYDAILDRIAKALESIATSLKNNRS